MADGPQALKPIDPEPDVRARVCIPHFVHNQSTTRHRLSATWRALWQPRLFPLRPWCARFSQPCIQRWCAPPLQARTITPCTGCISIPKMPPCSPQLDEHARRDSSAADPHACSPPTAACGAPDQPMGLRRQHTARQPLGPHREAADPHSCCGALDCSRDSTVSTRIGHQPAATQRHPQDARPRFVLYMATYMYHAPPHSGGRAV